MKMERKQTRPVLITTKKPQPEPEGPEEATEEPDVEFILQQMRVPELLSRIPPKRRSDLRVSFGAVDKVTFHEDWMLSTGKYRCIPLRQLKPGTYFELEEHHRLSENSNWVKTSALLKNGGRKVRVKWPRGDPKTSGDKQQ